MYNSELPDRAALPSARQLLRSTLLAAIAAAVLLVTVVMPAEYGVDPTGIGKLLGLKAMGEAKLALAKEANEPSVASAPATAPTVAPSASAPPAGATTQAGTPKSDEKSLLLKPGQGAEIKLTMRQGAKVEYSWVVSDGVVNFDAHGDSDDAKPVSHSYQKGTQAAGDKGTLEAKFDGKHGWYWRNRGKANVVVTLRTSGDYSSIARVL